MILRWYPDETRAWNLGSIITNGKVWTDFLNGQADSIGQIQLAHAYLKKLADAIPGAYVKEGSKPTHRYVAKGQTYVTIDALLAHEDVWIDAIKELTSAVAVALKSA